MSKTTLGKESERKNASSDTLKIYIDKLKKMIDCKTVFTRDGENRAEYGKLIIKNLADTLSALYGGGFDASNLYKYRNFYETFPILDALCLKSFSRLSWSHYRTLLQVENKEARECF